MSLIEVDIKKIIDEMAAVMGRLALDQTFFQESYAAQVGMLSSMRNICLAWFSGMIKELSRIHESNEAQR